jgi:ParB family chromosome partitioning protein
MSVVRVASCRPNPWNRRRPVDPDLRDSIKECGLLQPIVVREMGDGFEIIAGERRWAWVVEKVCSRLRAMIAELREGDRGTVQEIVDQIYGGNGEAQLAELEEQAAEAIGK